ncbi:transketolase [Steroidobacter denitrificans]|uniref:Transketolase n=1 Tax=Steroidobacter denitrificans TaxID=465721 RepID=A0A127F7Q0_STEDE|nr:transketolase C-terminal domain-containing protein [Steroidobacter denitrificans]AMN46437.1 transketolase [Steroidobacter denitrificans]
MRNAFIQRLSELAVGDKRILLITGDLGFGVLDDFERRFPAQYLNAGVAEQNMTAVATGLALEGHVVFTYSIGNFPTLRCLEQIRNDVCYHDANVKIVSIGGGFSYGQLGMSHHATEDLSLLRALPGIVVCAPGSAFEARESVDAMIAHAGPAYLRLERAANDFTDDSANIFVFGHARKLREGSDLTLMGAGGVVSEVVAASDLLNSQGIHCRVLSLHTLKPFDKEAVLAAAEQTGGILTVEENSVLGGLGGAVAEICLEHGTRPRRFLRLGIQDTYTSLVGDQAYLRSLVGIDRGSVALAARRLLEA